MRFFEIILSLKDVCSIQRSIWEIQCQPNLFAGGMKTTSRMTPPYFSHFMSRSYGHAFFLLSQHVVFWYRISKALWIDVKLGVLTILTITAWKLSLFEVFPVRIFPYSDWIPKDTPYLSVFSPNAGKCRPEKLRIRILYSQWISFKLR